MDRFNSSTLGYLALLVASGCGPAHQVDLLASDARSGKPVYRVQAEKSVRVDAFPENLLVALGVLASRGGPDDKAHDDGLALKGPSACQYRIRAHGCADTPIGDLQAKFRSGHSPNDAGGSAGPPDTCRISD
jgi:hypothetical protein